MEFLSMDGDVAESLTILCHVPDALANIMWIRRSKVRVHYMKQTKLKIDNSRLVTLVYTGIQ